MKKIFSKNWVVALAIGLTMLGTGCQAQQGGESKPAGPTESAPTKAVAGSVATINAADAEKMLADNAELQVLDVRTPEEVAGGVIKGAHTFNWFDSDFLAKSEAGLDKSKPVLVYCKVGGRSSQAADVLSKHGFTQVYNLKGGMMSWEGEGHPVQK